jgi:hypothetical protein
MDFLYGKFHAMPRIVTAWQRVSSPCFLRELVGSGGNSHSTAVTILGIAWNLP